MYLALLISPLLGAIFSGFLGFVLGGRGSSIIATCSVFFSFLCSLVAFYEVGFCGDTCHITLFSWTSSSLFNINWGFLYDPVTCVMLIVVTSISTLVHLYSTSYMDSDPHLSRFVSYLSFFTFFMLILVTGDNFMQLFLGWEGVGVSSYLLINFWFTRIQANKSAIKAMIVNRVGDFGLALGIALIFYTFKTLDYTVIFSSAPYFCTQNFYFPFLGFEISRIDLIGFLLFIGSMGKSAQIGLHTWLPDAMEGPTPVSALIHAATMVTAGVFLIVRCSPLFELMNWASNFIILIGALTAFFAASTGLVQNDLKRVIAYSTCSQLGYMIFSCGLSNYSAAFFHLTNHAFFKALLFLGAGAIIHSISDEQDMRRMGSFVRNSPYAYSCMTLGSLALMGFPYLSGFYSKDVIIETSYNSFFIDASFSFVLGLLAAFCTAFYSFRLSYLTFLNKPSGFKHTFSNFHETSSTMIFVLSILCVGSMFSGFVLKDIFVGMGSDFWSNSIYLDPNHRVPFTDYEYIPTSIKLIPIFCGLSGASLSTLFLHLYFNKKISQEFIQSFENSIYFKFYKLVVNFLGERWYFDKVYNNFIAKPLLNFGYYVSLNTLDKGAIEIVGPYGASYIVPKISKQFSSLQSGYIYDYASKVLLGLVLVTLPTGFIYTFLMIW